MNWLIPCNPNKYDVFGAFDKHGSIFWRQKVRYNIGDIVYIYYTKPYQKVMLRCVVKDIKVSSDQVIDDSEFWKDRDDYKKSLKMEFAKLQLLDKRDDEKLGIIDLMNNGLINAPQGPMRVKEDLLRYLEFNFMTTMTDQITTIQQLKDKVARFVADRNWNQFHNPKNLSMSIAIEASELMEIFQWMTEEEAWNINNSNERTHLKEELSDVIIYCMSLANQLDIDVTAAIEDKLKKNAIKYPVSNMV